jgi:hypothetical protein
MRRQAPRLAYADVLGRLAEIDRHELAVQVCHMQQRDVAEAVEPQKLLFGEALLRRHPAERTEPVRGRDRRRGSADLQNLAARDHMFPSACSGKVAAGSPTRTCATP